MRLSYIATVYYENLIETLQTRLVTIDIKEKRSKHKEEITIIKMVIVLFSNLIRFNNES